jgi:transcription elongation factor GreA
MAQREYLLTPEGFAKLKEELEYLKTVRRQEVAERIQGTLKRGYSEQDAEYEDAKREQAFVEGRILTIETMLKNAVIIQPEKADIVRLGSKVTVITQDGKPSQFTIVGSAEANPTEGKISNQSPVGQALLGKKVGDEVEVKVPAGTLRFLIIEIG